MNEFTGERVIPGAVEADLWNEHVSRYRFASLFTPGKRVLDAGCGTGYGTALLAEQAEQATGFDVSGDAIEYAVRHFAGPAFFVGAAREFPVVSASFDLVTAFEVIEHVEEWPSLVQEAARVLKPGGVFLVSTPNRLYYSETRKEAGPNPFHVHEFELQQFQEALGNVFGFVRILAQNRQEAIVFAGGCGEEGRAFFADEPVTRDAHFFLAVCSAQPVEIPCLAYVASGGNVLWERERHVALLDQQVNEARAEHVELLREHRGLQEELEKQNAWAMRLDAELRVERARLAQLIDQRKLIGRSRWIRLGRAFGVGPKLED